MTTQLSQRFETFVMTEYTRLSRQVADLLRDAKNLELLGHLRDDPRQPTSELARRVGMSAPAVRERILRLEEAGVIRGYALDLCPAALGYSVCAYVRVRPMPGALAKVTALACKVPEVVECHRVTGEDCLVLKVYIRSLDDLDKVLDQFLAYGQTTTSIVQSTAVQLRGLPLPCGTTGPDGPAAAVNTGLFVRADTKPALTSRRPAPGKTDGGPP